jgi:YesN/AraC family two-component response regulator
MDFFSKKLLLLFSFLFLYTAFLTFYSWSNSTDHFNQLLVYALLVPLTLYGIIIYLLLTHPHFSSKEKIDTVSERRNRSKYEKTGLSPTFSSELKSKLEYLMQTQKLYLNHELRLDDIADLLDISRHHASQVINENFNTSFYDFINSYRIEAVKHKLAAGFEDSSESISDIAYQCGFNNRVSFYKAFKKVTGSTPTEYLFKVA